MALDVMRLDVQGLKNLMANAKRIGNHEVYNQAFDRLCTIKPEATMNGELSSDPIVLECWRAIHAAEQIKTEINKKTTLLNRTRQKISRDGIIETMQSLALKKNPSDGFSILVEAGMPHLVFEYIIVKHPERFSSEAVIASQRRLAQHGIELKND